MLTGGGWFGFESKQNLTLNNTEFIDNESSCCYAKGYGYNLLSNATTTCQDTDTGDTHTITCTVPALLLLILSQSIVTRRAAVLLLLVEALPYIDSINDSLTPFMLVTVYFPYNIYVPYRRRW
jgi:hypothetical protein